jgi:predicted nucleic acid-binding Zn ribbon protein
MSSTLLRLGLWTLVLILALYVASATYSQQSWAEMIPESMLQQGLVVAVLVVIAGLVAKVFEKGQKVVSKNRCKICSKPIPTGAIYCREHLRNMLELEDRRTHNTRIR